MALSMDDYDRFLSHSTNPEPPPDWMHPQFNPNRSTVATLRSILLENGIVDPASMKKAGLVGLFENKLKPTIPRLLEAYCSVVPSAAGIFDMALGRHLTREDDIMFSRKHNPGHETVLANHLSPKGRTMAQSSRKDGPGHEAVPAHHPSLEGKTIAQIKTMMSKLDHPVSVPTKILLEPLKRLATQQLNLADEAKSRVQLKSQHHLDSDSHSDLTELSSSESEDDDNSELSQSESITEDTRPTRARKTRTGGGVKNLNQTLGTTHGAINTTSPPKRGRTVKPTATPQAGVVPVSPASNATGPPKRARAVKTPVKTPCQIPTATPKAGVVPVRPASNTTGPPKRARAVKTPCQIPTAALQPGVILTNGPADTPHLLAETPILDLTSEPLVSEPLIPSKPQAPPPIVPTAPRLSNNTTMPRLSNNIIPPLIDIPTCSSADPVPPKPNLFDSDDMRLLSEIDFSKPPPHESSRTSGLAAIFLDEPLEAYNFPIGVPVLPLTRLASQQKKKLEPKLAEIMDTPQSPSFDIAADKPLTTPNHQFFQPFEEPTTNDGFAPMDIDVIQVEEEEAQRRESEDIFQCLHEDVERAKLRLKTDSPNSGKLGSPTTGSRSKENQFVDGKTQAIQALTAANSDALALPIDAPLQPTAAEANTLDVLSSSGQPPNEDVFQCLVKDIEEAKKRLQSVKPISFKEQLPIRDAPPAAQTVTFESLTNPSKLASSVWTFPMNQSCAGKIEATPAPNCTRPTRPTNPHPLPQLTVDLEIPAAADSIGLALHTDPSAVVQLAVDLEIPTDADSIGSALHTDLAAVVLETPTAALPSSNSTMTTPSQSHPPSPLYTRDEDDGCTRPTDPHPLPQPTVDLEIPTTADSIGLALNTDPEVVVQLAVDLEIPTAADSTRSAFHEDPAAAVLETDRITSPKGTDTPASPPHNPWQYTSDNVDKGTPPHSPWQSDTDNLPALPQTPPGDEGWFQDALSEPDLSFD
ncbi:hypothetical protein KEM48_004409 [Puccinia striiformis f. sp. tritici PST-130]|uniref:HeH/LEM domain-containing protein n=1 Tax=Puccinia striiformis f. sp. tritici PST-78 TaxID=1165861 RepID=A0A0L0UQJ7_9BASI|nr:hypothetical protein KEM48_004409 [Puccinia striiformis f. sp. tritici PST-130]KNE89313.1 hypothetical protein PSTG_17227 [Puccinia striiformis f. sp. tritici PST-78]